MAGRFSFMLMLSALFCGFATAQPLPAADPGLTTIRSTHGVDETVQRFEAAVRAKSWIVFTRIDHAAAAEQAGLTLRPRTVVAFGNPKLGTAGMAAHPTLALDLPLRVLVWQDDAGAVWLTYNTAAYFTERIYPRHGIAIDAAGQAGMAALLAGLATAAVE